MKWRIALAGVGIVLLTACTSMQTDTRPLAELSGPEMYHQLCASCHGVDGHGDGPVAMLIKTGVSDLTRIAERNGGEFPTESVRRVIDGRQERPAHGPRDMPVWGWQFYSSENPDDAAERARVDALISRLVDYLRSIQQ